MFKFIMEDNGRKPEYVEKFGREPEGETEREGDKDKYLETTEGER